MSIKNVIQIIPSWTGKGLIIVFAVKTCINNTRVFSDYKRKLKEVRTTQLLRYSETECKPH